jgi:hypothetical protein
MTMSETEKDVTQSIMVSGSEFEFREPGTVSAASVGLS